MVMKMILAARITNSEWKYTGKQIYYPFFSERKYKSTEEFRVVNFKSQHFYSCPSYLNNQQTSQSAVLNSIFFIYL